MPAEQTQTPPLVTEQARVSESMSANTSDVVQAQEPVGHLLLSLSIKASLIFVGLGLFPNRPNWC